MKRDFELIRQILITAEEAQDYTVRSRQFVTDELDERTVAAHFELLQEAGLADANLLRLEGRGAVQGMIERLTWDGHEFLAAVRSDTAWNKAKHLVRDKGAAFTFEVLKIAASIAAKGLLP